MTTEMTSKCSKLKWNHGLTGMSFHCKVFQLSKKGSLVQGLGGKNTILKPRKRQVDHVQFIIGRRKKSLKKTIDYGFLPLQRINKCFLLLLKRHLLYQRVYLQGQSSLHNRVCRILRTNPYFAPPLFSFVRASNLLIWSVLDKTDLNRWESKTKVTTEFVKVLFCIFLIVSVIMLVNMLVALLTKTYDNITVS